jgi:hypothetical protein
MLGYESESYPINMETFQIYHVSRQRSIFLLQCQGFAFLGGMPAEGDIVCLHIPSNYSAYRDTHCYFHHILAA